MIKLSECGYPKRRLWVALKSVMTTLSDLVFDIANHQTILAPCEHCQRSEAFAFVTTFNDRHRTYRCTQCGRDIKVKNDLTPFGL